jgi:S1-C subfamily serine protease
MKRIAAALTLAAAGAVAGLLLSQGAASAANARAGIVDVNTNLGYQNSAAAGTGMVLTASGIVLTNNHVIRGATTIRVVDPSTHRSYSATVLGYDPAADVAVLKLKGAANLKTVQLGDSSKVRRGDAVTAIGNAGGTGVLTAAAGTVTGLQRTITASDGDVAEQLSGLIETDAALQPGDSGGPLVDASGRVIGMDTAASSGFYFQSGASDAYAIPINRAVSIAKHIESGHSATAHIGPTAFLGVSVQASGYDQGGSFVPGALVVTVVPGSPAESAGLVPGDLITAFNGSSVSSTTALAALVLHQSPGASVQLNWIDQSGNQQAGTVALASGPPQ